MEPVNPGYDRRKLALKGYEITGLAFALICSVIVWLTPISFSGVLVRAFFFKSAEVVAYVYLLSLAVMVYRAASRACRGGAGALAGLENIKRIAYPYWTPVFFLLTVRRLVAFFGVMYFFLHLKHVILFVNESNFDLFYWNLDRWLHLGLQPNVWMMENFGADRKFSVLVDWLYIKYFSFMLAAGMVFFLEIGGRRLAERFFFAIITMWALGGLSYLITPADGPCYAALYREAVPEKSRGHIFNFPVIERVPGKYSAVYTESKIWIAKTLQERLWVERKVFLDGARAPGMFYGIAAMPSLHVAVVFLIALFFYAVSPVLGAVGTVYAVIMLAGSVFLQWHYAVDGYAGIALALALWWLSGRIYGSGPSREESSR